MFALLLTLLACATPSAPVASPAPVAPSDATGALEMATPRQEAPDTSAAIAATVEENIPAGTYNYTRAKASDGSEVWAASTGQPPAVGSAVQISTKLPMKDFHSDTLKRDFPLVYFVESLTGGAAAEAGTAFPDGHPPVEASAVPPAVPSADAPVPTGPPAGAKKVAEIWSDRTSLNGREVTVSGKVVKSTPHILGRNWIHIQDGSGTDAYGDLTVTSADNAAVGDQITATGVVQIDQDFGAGYTYGVMVSGAKMTVTVPAGK